MNSTFIPEDFLTFSGKLLSRGGIKQNEALLRSAVSRAYYSAFLKARDKIDNKYPSGIDRNRYDIHKQVIEILKLFRSTDPDLSETLFDLKQYRIDADYHFDNAECINEHTMLQDCDFIDKQKVNDIIETAEDVIERIDLLP